MTNKTYTVKQAEKQAKAYLRKCDNCTKVCTNKCKVRCNAQRTLANANAPKEVFNRLGLDYITSVRYDKLTGTRIA